ncbi:hypothetical protein CRG98_013067 [Punica granatum]|uniref:Uncharacterized protein n=1 Tax=Punica granatum TaxID=22663 RepID=A0A2I0KE57_PUNGR|nr:hypothetical protein CRG98_013067 [Punica granatum]
MEETIRALQAGSSGPDYGDVDWNLFSGMRLPSKIKILDFKRFCPETPPTFLDLSVMEMNDDRTFQAYATEWRGKTLSKLGKSLTWASSWGGLKAQLRGRKGKHQRNKLPERPEKGKDATVGAVNSGRQAQQQFSVSYTPALLTS